MTQAPHSIYSRALGNLGYGYPPYIPEPSQNAPDAYRARGTYLADVGIKKANGSFDFLFNASSQASDGVNERGVPEDFQRLSIEPDDVNAIPHFFPPWAVIGKACVKDVNVELGLSAPFA